MNNDPAEGKLYHHLKTDGIYRVLLLGRLEATMETAVIYQSVKGGTVWVRTLSDFTENTPLGPRFQRLAALRSLAVRAYWFIRKCFG